VSGLVLDASIALGWCFPDEATVTTESLLGQVRDEGALVPEIWRFEVANVVVSAQRAKRIDADRSAEFFRLLDALPIRADTQAASRAFGPIYELARHEGLTAYDAAYLDLARWRGLPLATKDKELSAAAKRNGVRLLLP
jgi:predicted nucleic acid-binding protein